MSARCDPLRLLELRHAGLRQHRVRDARVDGSQRALADPAGPLQAVQQAGDAGGGEDDRPGEVDPPQPP